MVTQYDIIDDEMQTNATDYAEHVDKYNNNWVDADQTSLNATSMAPIMSTETSMNRKVYILRILDSHYI